MCGLDGKGKLTLLGVVVAASFAGLGYLGYRRGWIKKEYFQKVKETATEVAKKLNMRPEDLS